jgi:hypothetical protein
VYIQLLHKLGAMRFGSFNTYTELFGYLLGSVPLGDKLQNLTLAGSKAIK